MREGGDVGKHVMDMAQRQLDHGQLVEARLLAEVAGGRYVLPGLVDQCPRRAKTRLGLGELEPEARAVARFAERIAPRHDHLDEFVEHAAADADRPARVSPGAVAGEAQCTLDGY